MSGEQALLRPPPFPGLGTALAPGAAPQTDALQPQERSALFSTLQEARVGGEFWAEPHGPLRMEAQPGKMIVGRGATTRECDELRSRSENQPTIVLERSAAVDPWSILPQSRLLIAHGDDDWVALASVIGLDVELLSSGVFGAQGESAERLQERAADALIRPLRDPYNDGWLEPMEAIALLADWRRIIHANRGSQGEARGKTIVAACGISWWKRSEIRRFLWSSNRPVKIFASTRRALAAAHAEGGALAVWPSRIDPELIADARKAGVAIVRVEDGFVRSTGLGSNLVPPLSVIVDRRGIHFDPSMPSDLEHILANTDFSQTLVERAASLREAIVAAGISKYGTGKPQMTDNTRLPSGKRVVLVTGQVEDDMSVLAGGGGMTSNLELLRRAREFEQDAEILWRPHPDVDAGHRKGFVADDAALQYANRIVRAGSMADVLDEVDAVHVLTSLSGFEALLRGRDVTCHGTPFYAGWGLTHDLGDIPERRGRALTLDQLVAGVLLLYPRYLDPVSGLPCPPEMLVHRMATGQMSNRLRWVGPIRRLQGRAMALLRGNGKR